MNWESMSKQQRERAILGIMGVVVFSVVLYLFVLSPWQQGKQGRRGELNILQSNLSKSDSMRGKYPRLLKQVREQRAELNETLGRLPPEENALLWANRVIDDAARTNNLVVQAISELVSATPEWVQSPNMRSTPAKKTADVPGATGSDAPKKIQKRYGPYRVAFTVSGDFRDMVLMIHALQQANPQINISRFSVVNDNVKKSAQTGDVLVEWPRHSGPVNEKLSRFLLQNGGEP